EAHGPCLASEWDIRLPVAARRFDSVDGTRRYVVRLHDREMAETVFIPEENRNTVCISSQIGCALACTFCLTGQLGLIRNLSAGEIVAQALIAQRENMAGALRPSPGASHHPLPGGEGPGFNIVLMGMGEAVHNYDSGMTAIRIL